MEYRLEFTPTHPQERYFSLPKTVGNTPSDELLAIAEQLSETGPDTNIRTRILHNSIVSSAIIEAVMTTEDDDHHFDKEHIKGLELAERHLRQAYDEKYTLMEKGFDPPSEIVELLRIALRLKFMPVYKDMVYGEITDDTIEEVRNTLEDELLTYRECLSTRYDTLDTHLALKGLQGEVTALAIYWQKYSLGSQIVAVPATLRADDGNRRPTETHDLILFDAKEPGRFVYDSAIEIKTGGGVNAADRERYENQIVLVDLRTRTLTRA